MLGKGDGGLYKAPIKEERRKRQAKKRERDQIKFIDLKFERWQVGGLSELRWGKATVAYTKPPQREKEQGERNHVFVCQNRKSMSEVQSA